MMNTIPTRPVRRRGRAWLWAFLVLFVLGLVVAAACIDWVFEWDGGPLRVVFDGVEYGGLDIASLSDVDKLALGGGIALAALALLIAVPLVLLVAAACLAMGLILGLGIPLLLVALAAAIVLSPLGLLLMFVVWLWRKSASPAAPRAAKMAG
ncbi:MAG TPA: hypothetical protein VJ743_02990 [Albitalea sp.]|nr:hypothetical protein [Albitalea sp.]